ncbi:MAG: hypothetical protein R3F02_22020 [Thiolinea sp.]
MLVPVTCFAVWRYKPFTGEAACFLLAGLGSYGFYTVLAVNTALGWPSGSAGYSFSELQWGAFWLFMAALLLLITRYPVRMNLLTTAILLLSHAFLVFNAHFGWLEFRLYDHFVLQYLLPMVAILALSQWQVKKASGDPLKYAAARVLQLSLTPLFFIFCLVFLPIALKMTPLISSWFLELLAVSLFAGIAVAILRLRLYAMEYVWFHLWLWLSGGSLVILCALLLVWPLGVPNIYATGIAMVLGGFIYFPLRRWLRNKLLPLDKHTLHDFLALFSDSLAQASTPQAFDNSLQHAFQERFMPESLAEQSISLSKSRLENEGLNLRIPALQPEHSYLLTGKQNASRLFNQTDIQAATSMLDIARIAFDASENRQRAVLEERKRLLDDMHHTVGLRLSVLKSELKEPRLLDAAGETLQILDETIRLAMPDAPRQLRQHLAQWESEIRQRTESSAVALAWQVDSVVPVNQELSPRQALELAQFIREAVSNALKHARLRQLCISFSYQAESLRVTIHNDGKVSPPEKWQAGTGLSSMEARVHALNGSWAIRYLPESESVSIEVEIPLVMA